VVCLVVGEFGKVMNLPSWVIAVSPFSHVPKLPGAAMAWTPLVVLALVAAALLWAGATGFRRRDVPA
jgi:ABC-2 type transport system permease protein